MDIAKFNGFLSYAHSDARADESLFDVVHTFLQSRVDARLINGQFSLWRDTEKLKVGDRWNSEIEIALRDSHVLVIMFSPKWLESENCVKEMQVFRDVVEKGCGRETLIAPIMIRNFDNQLSHFTKEQKDIYDELNNRQYIKMLASEMLTLERGEQIKMIDRIADDIAGIIERWRLPHINSGTSYLGYNVQVAKKRVEFDHQAHDFSRVDPISDAGIFIDVDNGEEERGVYAYIDCIPRMYVQTQYARIEFGIRRAFLTIEDSGLNFLHKNEKMHIDQGEKRYAYYVRERDGTSSITICIDPKPGNLSIQENPLPPSQGENRLTKVAIAAPCTEIESLTAKISIRLNTECLFIFSADPNQTISASTAKKISSIINVAAEKDKLVDNDVIEKNIPVRRRDK